MKIQDLKKRVALLDKHVKQIHVVRWEAIKQRDLETKRRQKVIDKLERLEISAIGKLHKAREKLRIVVAKAEEGQ